MTEKDANVQRFLDLIKKSRRGKFKIYVGMSAGVGKTYRMLQEAHALIKNGVDVQVGYIETHQRRETEEMLRGLPIIPRKQIFYKGKALEEMNLQAILNTHPEVVLVDELAHTNVAGSKNEKRWQDILDILHAGINVISAVNIQHIESLNETIRQITGIEVQERVPDSILAQADEVVNIDLTAEELINRLKDGKIYPEHKIGPSLQNFFKSENILHLRELALKEVASQVERKVESEFSHLYTFKQERLLACISSNENTAKRVLRKTARLANYYNCKWYALYIQTPKESGDRIPLDKQRFLINNFKLATELGAEIIKIEGTSIAKAIIKQAEERNITTICLGKPHASLFKIILAGNVINKLLQKISTNQVDIVILS